ncbi:transferase family-domain-containing protein [Aspergillus pseudonomiae]|uniref:Transferase family-domain-containing protein n=1 Tax=Aspergillus pseudonomiae TaxID=1506151 RepID=A0A5N6HT25_9EURO|nr:transferase family-domain-containing protein [Aspergillus pseudonomiae]KAB8257641.1 transferase family-domain-containing protein [Aspergillus pseudonomiae]KAE8399887.1 transferase family-domain-containing protein [Aspergillus pseudonomiae]
MDFFNYPLTAFDSASPRGYPAFLLFFRSTNPQTGLQALEDGVAKLIQRLPFLAGDIHPCPCDHPFKEQIQPSPRTLDKVPMFQSQYQSVPMSSVVSQLGSAIYTNTLCPIRPRLDDSEPHPVLRFQGTQLKDGIVLSMSFSHNVFDAAGAGYVLESLAACCYNTSTGGTDAQMPLALDPEADLRIRQVILDDVSRPYSTGQFSENYRCNASEKVRDELASVVAVYHHKMYTLSANKIQILRTTCNNLTPCFEKVSSSQARSLSRSDIVSAALALCVKRSRAAAAPSGLVSKPKEPGRFALAVNLRPRLRKVGAEKYFGSFMTTVQINSIQKDVSPGGGFSDYRGFDLLHLTRIALNFRQKVAAVTPEYVHELGSHLRQQKNIRLTTRLAEFGVTDMRPLKMYSLNFGGQLGFIDYLWLQLKPIDGTCVIMPARIKDSDNHYGSKVEGSWDVLITLKPNVLDTLEKDPLFSFLVEKKEQLVGFNSNTGVHAHL